MYTVLLVDDSAFMRKWIAGILHEAKQYKVIAEASNGREAILQYHSNRPDIVIMDVSMDEMDGIKALEHLIRLFPGIKVIMCSSLGHTSYIEECMEIGAKDFIIKPRFEDLISKLNNIVS